MLNKEENKKYDFKLTLEEAEIINNLIDFKIEESIAWNLKDYEKTINLSKSLNKQIGYFQAVENNKVEKED